jgi:hypothetical protein
MENQKRAQDRVDFATAWVGPQPAAAPHGAGSYGPGSQLKRAVE